MSTTSSDPTWDKVPSAFYGVIEANLGITCACLVTLRPLVHRLRQLFSRSGTEEPQAEKQPQQFGYRVSPHAAALSSFGSTQIGSHTHDVELRGVDKDHDASAVSATETLVRHEESSGPQGSSSQS